MAFSPSSTSETGQAQTATNRAEVRKRSFIAGTISFNKGLSTCECVIRNLSEKGARLAINSEVPLPAFFHLYIPVQQKRLYAELKWRSEGEAGIQFCNEASKAPATMGHPDEDETATLRRRVRQLEAEVLRLQNRILQLTDGTI